MLLQGERVNYLNVDEMIGNIFGDSMHQKRQESLANAVLGVMSSASLIVHRMGLGLAKAKECSFRSEYAHEFEVATNFRDFKQYHPDWAIEFKHHLSDKINQ